MWDIVWVSLQGHRSVCVSRHFLLQAPQCPCSVRKRFSRDHCCWGRSKPGCRIAGSHTRWELTTWADFQLCLHRLLMSAGCNSSHSGFLICSVCFSMWTCPPRCIQCFQDSQTGCMCDPMWTSNWQHWCLSRYMAVHRRISQTRASCRLMPVFVSAHLAPSHASYRGPELVWATSLLMSMDRGFGTSCLLHCDRLTVCANSQDSWKRFCLSRTRMRHLVTLAFRCRI